MVFLSTDPGTTIIPLPTVELKIKDSLSDPTWSSVPDGLKCNQLKIAVNAYDTATFSYIFGLDVLQIGSTTISDHPPLDLEQKYIRVEVTRPDATVFTWFGYIHSTTIIREAVVEDGEENKLTGKGQQFTAVGLEYFLDRKQIDTAYTLDKDDNEIAVNRPLVFNGGMDAAQNATASERGNKHPEITNANGSFYFGGGIKKPEEWEEWSAKESIQHLLDFQGPKNTASAKTPAPYELAISSEVFLENIYPTIGTEGQTVYQVLNRICSPQRGLCWWLEYLDSGAGHKCQIYIQSFFENAITLPSGGAMPANSDQISMDFDTQLDVEQSVVTRNRSRIYDRVVGRGARMTSTFTVGVADGTLETDWTAAMETEYKAGASADADYGALTTEQKKQRDDAYRKSERLARVYSSFRIPSTWDGKSSDGKDVALHGFSIPTVNTNGSIVGGEPLRIHGMKLLNRTLLRSGWDYSNVHSPVKTTPATTEERYMPTLGLIRVENSPDLYQKTESVSGTTYNIGTPETPNPTASYGLRLQTTVPGFIFNSSIGLNHTLGLNHFDVFTGDTEHPAEVDYATLRVTCTAEADTFAEMEKEAITLPTNRPLEILTVYFGSAYRLDYVAANTVFDISKGVPQTTNGGILRDDRKRLQDLVEMAFEWYSVGRTTLSVGFKQFLRNEIGLGALITKIGTAETEEQIGTVISLINYDLANYTTTIQTADATLDIRALA